MKLRSVKHLTYEGFKNIWDNRLMSLASIGVLISCMALIGAAMLVTFNVDRAMAAVEKENVVMVYLNDYNSVKYSEEYIDGSNGSSSAASSKTESSAANAMDSDTSSDSSKATETAHSDVPEEDYLIHNDEEALAVCEEIKHIDNVATVEYVSAKEGIDRLVGRIDKEQAELIAQLEEEGENPLSCAAQVTLNDLSLIDETISKIEKVEGVYKITSQLDVASKVTSMKNAIYTSGYIIIAVLMIIALIIVCNTIRVTMFNRKLEISIMKAVGATDSFIRLPFVVEGVAIGLVSAAVTLGLLYVGYSAVLSALQENIANPVPYSEHILEFAGIFAGVGVLSGCIGSVFMINKYLRKEGSEFSAMS